MQSKALARSLDHALRGQNFRLPYRGRGFNVDNDRVVSVDQVVRRIGEEGLAAMRSCPACRWIGRRDELRRDFARGTESGIIKDREVLRNRTARSSRWQTLVAVNPLLTAGFGFYQAAVDGEPFATDQAFLNAPAHH